MSREIVIKATSFAADGSLDSEQRIAERQRKQIYVESESQHIFNKADRW